MLLIIKCTEIITQGIVVILKEMKNMIMLKKYTYEDASFKARYIQNLKEIKFSILIYSIEKSALKKHYILLS